MKMLKITGLFALCLINKVHSMEPVDRFIFERQFLQGTMSAEAYLSHIAELSGEYAYKIRALRNAQAIGNPQSPYQMFLQSLNQMPMMAQQILNANNQAQYESMVQSTQDYVIKAINVFYADIKRGGQIRYGRES